MSKKKRTPDSERLVMRCIEDFGEPPGLRRNLYIQLDGHTFEFDFAWPDVGVVIEADGLGHDMHPRLKRMLYRRWRDHKLSQAGWQVFHVRTYWRNPKRLQAHVDSLVALVYRLQASA